MIWGSFAFHQGDMIRLMSDERISELIERLAQVCFKRPPFTQCASLVLFLIARDSSKINYIPKDFEDLQTEILIARENHFELKSNDLWERIKLNLLKVSNLYPLIPISWFAAFEYLNNPDEFFNLWYLFSSEIFTKYQSNEITFIAILFSPVILLLSIEKPNGIYNFFKNGLDFIKYLACPKGTLMEVSQSSLNTISSILGKMEHSNEILNSFITLSTLLGHRLISSINISFSSFDILEYIYAADVDNRLYKLFLSIEDSITFSVPINEIIQRVDFFMWFANYSKRYSFNIVSIISKQTIKLYGKNALIYAKVLNRLLSSKKFELFKDEINYYQSEALHSCFMVSEWYNSCISDSKIMKGISKVLLKAQNHEKSDKLLSKLALKLVMCSGSSPEIGLAHTIGFIIWNEKSIYLPKSLLYELVDPDLNLLEYFKTTHHVEEDVVLDEYGITSILMRDDPFVKKLRSSTPSKWSFEHIERRMTCLEMLRIYINSWIKADNKTGILNQKITLEIIISLFGAFVKSFLKDYSSNTNNLKSFSDKLQNVIMQIVKLLKFNHPRQYRIKISQKRIFELCNTSKMDKNSTSKVLNLGIKLLRILDEYNKDKNVKIGGINLVNKCISHRSYGGSALLLLATNLPRVFTNFDLDKARVPTLAGLALEAATKASKNRNVDRADFMPQLNSVLEYLRKKYVSSSVPNCIDKGLRKFSRSINPNNSMLEGANVKF